MPSLKAGTRLTSAVCDTEIIVIRAVAGDHDLRCGGQPMLELGAVRDPALRLPQPAGGGTLVGKRYVDAGDSIEVLCTRSGAGTLALDGAPLILKQTKALPSSD